MIVPEKPRSPKTKWRLVFTEDICGKKYSPASSREAAKKAITPIKKNESGKEYRMRGDSEESRILFTDSNSIVAGIRIRVVKADFFLAIESVPSFG